MIDALNRALSTPLTWGDAATFLGFLIGYHLVSALAKGSNQ